MMLDLLDSKNPRLNQQLEFLLETNKLKHVLGRTLLPAGRRENYAEHSWHLAMLAVLLAEYANQKVDIRQVILLLLVHDVVKVYTDDFCMQDEASARQQAILQQQAAEQLFRLLPPDQAGWVCQLWEEFRQRATPAARFADAIDRFQSILLNYTSRGEMWRQCGLTASRLLADSQSIADGSTELWQYAEALIRDAVQFGFIRA